MGERSAVDLQPSDDEAPADPRLAPPRWWARAGILVLLAVLSGWAGDIRVGSGSDAAGKLATARVMAEGWTCDPDVGWWAEEHDPDAALHQLVNTEVHGDQFIQATSVSYQCAVMPLQRVMGPWGPVSLSILGAVAAGLAAARIAFRLGAGPLGEVLAFWLVGLAGPAFVYALDVWEHAPALGLAAWVVALGLGTPTVARGVAMGVLAGAAATLRAESVLYMAAFVAASLSVRPFRRAWIARPVAVVAGGLSAVAVAAAYVGLERLLVESTVRAARSGSLAGQAGGALEERFTTALVTTVGVFASEAPAALLIGVLLCGVLLVYGRRTAKHPEEALEPVDAASGGAVLARLAEGAGFVPGVLPAAPMAALGAFTSRRSPGHQVVVRTAVVAPVLVLALQWTSNLAAQWGSRYLLSTGLLLTAAGCTLVPRGARRLPARLVLVVAVSAMIAIMGSVWRAQRSNAFAHLVDRIEDVPDDSVVVTSYVNLGREAGGSYGDVRWLVAQDTEEIELARAIVGTVAPTNLTVVVAPGFAPLDGVTDGYRRTATEQVDLLGTAVTVERYQFERTFP